MLNHSVVRRKSYLEGQRILFGNDFLTVTKFSDFIHSFALLCFGNVKTLPIVWGWGHNTNYGNEGLPQSTPSDIDLRQLPSRLIENTNPLSKLLAKCSGLSIENASLVLGQCLGMNLYGRFHTNEVHRKGEGIRFYFPIGN